MTYFHRFLEQRFTVGTVGDDGPPIVEGYAARFNTLSHELPASDYGVVRERIEPGAFRKVLKAGGKVMALYQHESRTINETLGSTASVLKLREDSNGLFFSLQLGEHDGRLADLVRRGDITQASMAFRWDSHTMEFPNGAPPVRSISNVSHLRDISLVAYPAYEATSAAIREAEEAMNVRCLDEWRAEHPTTFSNLAAREMHLRNIK